jgi:hypothetical protein
VAYKTAQPLCLYCEVNLGVVGLFYTKSVCNFLLPKGPFLHRIYYYYNSCLKPCSVPLVGSMQANFCLQEKLSRGRKPMVQPLWTLKLYINPNQLYWAIYMLLKDPCLLRAAKTSQRSISLTCIANTLIMTPINYLFLRCKIPIIISWD